MAGRNKSNAWNSVKFIKAHLPIWQEKGMSKKFLDDIIDLKYSKCEIDVYTALTCDPMFETAYNQPDFIDKLKAVCKKHRMPYGKVKPEIEVKAEEDTDIAFAEMFNTGKICLRVDGQKEKGFKDIEKHLNNLEYSVHKVKNINNILSALKNRTNGDKKLVVNKTNIELLLSLARDKKPVSELYKYMRLSENSIRRYYSMLHKFNLGHFSKNKKSIGTFVINYDAVEFTDGYKPAEFFTSTLFGGL